MIQRKKQTKAVEKAKIKYDKIYNAYILDIGRTKADI